MVVKLLNNDNFPKINAGLFLFYLAILGNYTGELLPNGLVTFIEKNRFVQLVISFFLLLFTVNLYTSNLGFVEIFKYSLTLWVWYILTSKQYLSTSLIIISLLLLSFVAYNLSENTDNEKNMKSKQEKKALIEKYKKFQNICFIGIIVVSIIGGGKYYLDHYRQYRKSNKNYIEFLINYLFKGRGKRSEIYYID